MTALPRATHATAGDSVALIGAPKDTVHFEFRVADPQRQLKVREVLDRVKFDNH
ncbi:hypothetical protein [Nocardia wallacei]|uniref:hypothetical protein n=1 Tax=Nocardia wallacei TaxID=480035 RepID=UPI0024568FD9|nr:hypothetical protein [Nocardia wallacei]